VVNKGLIDGARTRLPVLNMQGLVGIVTDVSHGSSTIRLLIDPGFSIGVLIQESRETGILEGRGDPHGLRLILEEPQKEIHLGDTIITSGFEGSLYPKGLLIGHVRELQANKFGMRYAVVEPTVTFDRLEEVLMITDVRKTVERAGVATLSEEEETP